MMSTSDNFSATLLPSSLVSDLFPSASMTPTGSTTTSGPTTTPSIDQVTCGGDAVLVGGNTTMRLLAPHVVVYACKPGYQETGDGVNVIECNSNTWKPSTPLQCVLVEEEEEPVKEVPTWIPALIILMVIFLVVVVVVVVVVAVWVCRGNHFRQPITTWQQEEQEQNQQEHLQPRPPTPKKPEKTTRRWPWQRPSKPPPGHFGLDGVAWTVSPDDSILPVKRRF
ncbi:hypothetical protein V1264_017181 [Littorina saxatilis]|uniref:Sushi domain-containing protein n=2 Tax=Littorina saxatilis TaxID=31220 RepID=A0AAN9BHP0_9CAEN